MKRIVIANFYPVWPPIGGGQRRIFFLARELSKAFDVELVVPERSGVNKTLVLSPTLKEVRVAVEKRFRAMEHAIDERVKMSADVAYAMHWQECQQYQATLARHLKGAAAAVTAHPYSIEALLAARPHDDFPIVFDSQNVEAQQKASVLKDFPDLLAEVRKIEESAIKNSRLTIACSTADADTFAKDHKIKRKDVRIIENGVDAMGVPVIEDTYRSQLRAELKCQNALLTVFGGSYHHPNFRAVEKIIGLAKKLPNVVFLILGSVCRHESVASCKLPNVIAIGEVDESTKWLAFKAADIGLNPMELGSGTNIKMFEYAAAGLPVLSTPFGARGVGLEAEKECIIREIGGFEGELQKWSGTNRPELAAIGASARKTVLQTADWSVIGRKYVECFRQLLTKA